MSHWHPGNVRRKCTDVTFEHHYSVSFTTTFAILCVKNCQCFIVMLISQTILVGTFHLARLMKNVQVVADELATELNPINCNVTGSRCNIIEKLNAAPHLQRPAHLACMKSFDVYHLQSDVRLSGSCMLLWTMISCLYWRRSSAQGVSKYYIGTVDRS